MTKDSLNIKFSYTLLQYMHDAVTGEFVNLGIVLYSHTDNELHFQFISSASRITNFFPGSRATHIKRVIASINKTLSEISKRNGLLDFKGDNDALTMACNALIQDDSAFQWSTLKSGITSNASAKTEALFSMFASRYLDKSSRDRVTDGDIWRNFKSSLPNQKIIDCFTNKTISVSDDSIEFDHAWKNGIWHCIEPLSFDLKSPDRIRDKAHKWLGQIASVAQTSDEFKVYFLLGNPDNSDLAEAYLSAQQILRKCPADVELIGPDRYAEFGKAITDQIVSHNQMH